jgi:DNA helicase-2/ATP-dependent DNA helicase PcrA
MQSAENRVIVACAGSGKTTRLVDQALADRDRRIAVITYTNNNAREIVNKFGQRNSGVPKHVDVMTWFGFLLRECARPYQRSKYAEKRIESLLFVNKQSAMYVKESDTRRHYFANGELLYSDKAARFVVECEAKSGSAVTARLRQIYTDVLVDEFQDLGGWDLEVIKMLFQSGIRVTLVGDPRQHIYSTNPSKKHRRYQGVGIIDLVQQWKKSGLCSIEFLSTTHRCNGPICDFSNALWQGLHAMTPDQTVTTGHDGVFLVAKTLVPEYIARFSPRVLRHDKRTKTYGSDGVNFGLAKGLEFPRVLIIPTEPMRKYLRSGAVSHVENSRDKLHVAVTRARHSVAFVYDGPSPLVTRRWVP